MGRVTVADYRQTEIHATSQDGQPTHTTIITDNPRRSGGGMLMVVLVLLVLVVGALWIASGMSGSEVAKDNAVAQAADKVGNAAAQVGDAAQDVADDVTSPNQ